MIPNNTVRKEVVPHYRPTEKNVGGSSLFPSHPLSEGSWKLIADDMRKNRR